MYSVSSHQTKKMKKCSKDGGHVQLCKYNFLFGSFFFLFVDIFSPTENGDG